jgi:hypothetical protein
MMYIFPQLRINENINTPIETRRNKLITAAMICKLPTILPPFLKVYIKPSYLFNSTFNNFLVNDLIDIKDGYAALEICQGALYTIMNFCPRPHIAVLELFENIDLPGSGRCIYIPAAPVSVIVEIILSGAGLKDSVTRYGPGECVFEGIHYPE